MLVRHTVTRAPFTVAPEDRCLDVLRTFRARGFRHAPVVEDGALVGIISERDLVRALPALVESFSGEEGKRSLEAPVRSVMTRGARTCAPSDPVDVVAREMLEDRLGCMAVVSNDEVVGIVTTVDLLRGFTDHLLAPGVDALSLVWTRGGVDTVPDVPSIAVAAGARLAAYFVTETTTGALALLVRIDGGADACARFQELCVEAGLLSMGTRAA
ncbi:MAG: CBS domain-containing protein [Planctomycetota bacterium]